MSKIHEWCWHLADKAGPAGDVDVSGPASAGSRKRKQMVRDPMKMIEMVREAYG